MSAWKPDMSDNQNLILFEKEVFMHTYRTKKL